MAQEVRAFAVTIPAGTLQSANFKADVSFPARSVKRVEFKVPPGPRGTVGFALGSGGQRVIPDSTTGFIITDDENIGWDLEGLWDSGSWALFGYNTGGNDHTIYVRFLLDSVHVGTGPNSLNGAVPITGMAGTNGGPPPTDGGPPPGPPPTPAGLPPPSPGQQGAPLTLPPALPGIGPAQALPVPESLLIGIDDMAQVWLLSENLYTRLWSLDVMQSLLQAGIPGVHVSRAFHEQLTAAGDVGTANLGGQLDLTGQLEPATA